MIWSSFISFCTQLSKKLSKLEKCLTKIFENIKKYLENIKIISKIFGNYDKNIRKFLNFI